jgi:hypothetical protein
MLVLGAFFVGGLAHFSEALISLICLGLGAAGLTGGLLIVWKSARLQIPTKGAITLFAVSGVVSWIFIQMQPPDQWPAVDVQVTKIIHPPDSTILVSGLIHKGLFPTQVELQVPDYTEVPAVGQNLTVYRDPFNTNHFSTLPEVSDGPFVHLELAVLGGLTLVGGVACVVMSWRRGNQFPSAPSRNFDPLAWASS